MTETEHSLDVQERFLPDESGKYAGENNFVGTAEESLSEPILSLSHDLEKENVTPLTETLENNTTKEEKMEESATENSKSANKEDCASDSGHDNALDTSSNADNNPEEEWLDIMGSGNFKKKVLKKGLGHDTRPDRGDIITASIVFYLNGAVFEENENLKFVVGDLDVIQGLDLVVCLMENGEKAKVIIPSKLAYGKLGRTPDIPPNSDLECDIEIKEIERASEASLTVSRRLGLGNQKRAKGNFFYERGEYIDAIHCYERASEYLDGINDCSGSSPEESQEIVDTRIKVYNNMAASHLKLNAYDAALRSVENVLNVQPQNMKALFRKSKILSAKGNTDEAITCINSAIRLQPDEKVFQAELVKLRSKKKMEEQSQKAMYQRMFPQSQPKKSKSFSKLLKWSAVTGGLLAVAAGLAMYRQIHL